MGIYGGAMLCVWNWCNYFKALNLGKLSEKCWCKRGEICHSVMKFGFQPEHYAPGRALDGKQFIVYVPSVAVPRLNTALTALFFSTGREGALAVT